MVDIYLTALRLSKYPSLATDTEVNTIVCFVVLVYTKTVR